MSDVPAVLGGSPVFAAPVPVSSATLPPFERVAPSYREIFESRMITTHRHVREFEARLAARLGVEQAVAFSSNSLGLLLTLKCLGLRGEVVVPSFTFSVTGHVLAWNGLRPVYVDIDPETCLVDPVAVEKAITPETCAILAVHIWGNPCERERLEAIAASRRLTLVFDAAQAMGSRYRDGAVGTGGRAEVFSLSPTKLVTSGEGGVVATNDVALARELRTARNYGSGENYDCLVEGLNGRMSELHAALGLASLEMLDASIAHRLRLIALYRERLGPLPGIRFQRTTPGATSNGVYFSILVDPAEFGLDRDRLGRALKAENVDTRSYYHPPLHRQSVNAEVGRAYLGQLPNTDLVANRALTLPMYSHMTEAEVQGIADAVARIHRNAARIAGVLA